MKRIFIPGHQLLDLYDQRGQLVAAGVDRLERAVEVVDHLADDLVLVGDRGRERRGVGQQRLDRAALALKDLDDLVGQLVDVVRRQRAEQRLEAVEQLGEVQR